MERTNNGLLTNSAFLMHCRTIGATIFVSKTLKFVATSKYFGCGNPFDALHACIVNE